MAATFRQEAQNSNSPKALTLSKLTPTSSTSAHSALISTGTPGKKNWKYRPMAISSATPVMAQLMKYIHPDRKAPFLPKSSPAYETNEPDVCRYMTSSPSARISRYAMTPAMA